MTAFGQRARANARGEPPIGFDPADDLIIVQARELPILPTRSSEKAH